VILGIDHLGIAVRQGETAAADFARLTGWPAGDLESVAGQGVRVCFIPEAGAGASARLELLQPESAAGGVAQFLERRGEGLHHVCFAVDDIAAELARLVNDGFVAVDPTPRRGHGGQVAFLHPRSAHGVLIELLQRDPDRGDHQTADGRRIG
jgi:methylmalonyl-CoA/ethylmalonyl-CoA epimerase